MKIHFLVLIPAATLWGILGKSITASLDGAPDQGAMFTLAAFILCWPAIGLFGLYMLFQLPLRVTQTESPLPV